MRLPKPKPRERPKWLTEMSLPSKLLALPLMSIRPQHLKPNGKPKTAWLPLLIEGWHVKFAVHYRSALEHRFQYPVPDEVVMASLRILKLYAPGFENPLIVTVEALRNPQRSLRPRPKLKIRCPMLAQRVQSYIEEGLRREERPQCLWIRDCELLEHDPKPTNMPSIDYGLIYYPDDQGRAYLVYMVNLQRWPPHA